MNSTEGNEGGAARHTPGPWRVGYRSLHVMADNAKIGGDTPICDIRGWGYLTGNGHGALGLDPKEAAEIQDANARLIASAPELLKALRIAANEIRQAKGYTGDSDAHFHMRAAQDAIHAAIAKAEGRT